MLVVTGVIMLVYNYVSRCWSRYYTKQYSWSLLERHKQAKIRKRRYQKKIPTPKTKVGKNQTNNQVLYTMKHIVSRMTSYFPNRWPLSYLNWSRYYTKQYSWSLLEPLLYSTTILVATGAVSIINIKVGRYWSRYYTKQQCLSLLEPILY